MVIIMYGVSVRSCPAPSSLEVFAAHQAAVDIYVAEGY
jgi:hypothetical protein